MQTRQIMTSPVVTVGPDATLRDAVGRMLEHRVGSVVVVDSGLLGIVTRSDVLRAAYRAGGSLADLTVTDAMSEDVVTTTATTTVNTLLGTMDEHDIKKLPVVEDFELVGIVTMTDIARHQPESVREVRDTMERKDDWTD